MESTICMNELCRGATTSSSEWKKGWSLKSGGFAKLCYNCGSAYENVAFCEMFHLDESGWRKCRICGKHIHCGCIASKYLYECMDYGGVGCVSCVSGLGNHALRSIQPIGVENRVDGDASAKGKLLEFSNAMETCESVQQLGSRDDDNNKQEKSIVSGSQVEACLPNLNACKSFDQPSLNTPVNCSSSFNGGREQNKVSPLHQGQSVHHVLPKEPRASQNHDSKSKGGIKTQTNIARRAAEGRGGRNRLLPRYQSRITDQELKQLSGDLKSTVVPLFDKVLTASDAGRIGRLVLPKACAEAYFPPIDQSEGLPINIQDIKGKEWTFLFRFWLNNNSRMYVLEGVNPCIRSMQLQAGDIVTFSRIDPEGKLVMSFRKVTNNGDTQGSQHSTLPAAAGVSDNHTAKQLTMASVASNGRIPLEKKTQNIGSKSKRFLMHVEDAIELRITMEEAQDMFCPPPSLKPTILTIEDIEFEAYHEPPVFGKAAISVPDEINQTVLDASLGVRKGSKRQKIVTEKTNDCEPSGLDALNTDKVLEDNISGLGNHSVGATTKHPRHHPGCTCIVCVQPPSGMGKHQPMCDCNICSTLRRRLNTFNLRKKKKKLPEHETELAVGKDELPPSEMDTANEPGVIHMNSSENDSGLNRDHYNPTDLRSSKGQLDLNCHPSCEDDLHVEAAPE